MHDEQLLTLTLKAHDSIKHSNNSYCNCFLITYKESMPLKLDSSWGRLTEE